MSESVSEQNRELFNRTDVVAHYGSSAQGLTMCERLLFERFLRSGMDVLDLGVGAGRSTPYLAALGGRYVGVDYAPQMVEAARRLHPGIEFAVGDARNLSEYGDASFDAAVFTWNGIDYIHPEAGRAQCIAECVRVLRVGGIFIVSSHCPRAAIAQPRDPSRHGRLYRLGARTYLSVRRLAWMCRTEAFFSGAGYARGLAHGGLVRYSGIPRKIITELESAGLVHLETLSCNYPAPSSQRSPRFSQWFTPWYYYVARRP